MNYKRNVDELRKVAAIWWPSFLSSMETEVSIIPLLIQSQDKFISLLKLSDKTPFSIFEVMKSAGIPGNLLLKHLVILADVGGETLQRINADFASLF
ncbi:restriction endonuclease, partial [Candidatus Parcubacteria bacterium]|nr:restriction endonuclease [Candidatus Parcubacteria bacterium]